MQLSDERARKVGQVIAITLVALRQDTLTAIGLFSLATVIAAIAINEFATSTLSNP